MASAYATPLKIVAGSGSAELGRKIADSLQQNLVRCEITRFADGEIGIKILESVRGTDVYVVNAAARPVNENLMETFLLMDALRRSSVGVSASPVVLDAPRPLL